jgi:murein DD-endopeptidase MepM/ murein hydrolase activator NlpD/acylphosphatase
VNGATTAAEIVVEGQVQGVGFRTFVQRRALQLGLAGFVMNLRDGRVRARAEGPRRLVEDLVRDLEKGPPLSRVELHHPLRGVRAVRLRLRACARRLGGATCVVVAAAAAVAPSALGETRAPAPPLRVHVVDQGDTLYAIARRNATTVKALVGANRLPSADAPLRVGQRLVIPGHRASIPVHREAAPGRRVAPPDARRPVARASLELGVPDFVERAPAFVWPVEGTVTSAFGRRRSGWHAGIDIKAPAGSPVRAAAAGLVTASGEEFGYGRVVRIAHVDGFVTVYAHNKANLVRVGARVRAGDRIATVGRTGLATADHVHFEILRQGRAYNPLYLLPLPARVAQVDESGPEERF